MWILFRTELPLVDGMVNNEVDNSVLSGTDFKQSDILAGQKYYCLQIIP
jgi:hypothetical protein